MWGATVGFFGKLPSNGDFIERRVGGAFRDLWDDWMQRCMVESQRELGGRWLDCYLTSPMWRFFLCDGVAGAASYAGVLLPSVDRVGRYFPLTVVVELPADIPAAEFARAASDWFGDVEHLCADALQNPDFELANFDAALAASAAKLAGVDQLAAARAFPAASPQWHWPSRSVDAIADAVSAPLMGLAQGALRPMTMWWTEGSELVQPSVLLVRSLPRPDSFGALLAGTWDDGRWDGEVAPAPAMAPLADTLEAPIQYAIESAAATDTGMVRRQNQDNFLLNDGNRLWAVADGMGGHSHGEVASQMIVDSLNALEPTSSLNACLQAVAVALERVNSDLRRAALGVGGRAESGSTVVALAIRGHEWGVAWAGDSRAYIYRGASLLQLTHDHTLAGELLRSETSESTPAASGAAAVDTAGALDTAAAVAAVGTADAVDPAAAGVVAAGVTAVGTADAVDPAAPGVAAVSAFDIVDAAATVGTADAAAASGAGAPAGSMAASGEITRAVGGHDELQLDRIADRVAPGDRFLLCSDGLYRALDDSALIACLQQASADEASNALISAARAAGARDNVTAVIVDVKA
ncbi:MAG: type VI secretion system-associated protein TagF [Steroidobacteraceae bacterium]